MMKKKNNYGKSKKEQKLNQTKTKQNMTPFVSLLTF